MFIRVQHVSSGNRPSPDRFISCFQTCCILMFTGRVMLNENKKVSGAEYGLFYIVVILLSRYLY